MLHRRARHLPATTASDCASRTSASSRRTAPTTSASGSGPGRAVSRSASMSRVDPRRCVRPSPSRARSSSRASATPDDALHLRPADLHVPGAVLDHDPGLVIVQGQNSARTCVVVAAPTELALPDGDGGPLRRARGRRQRRPRRVNRSSCARSSDADGARARRAARAGRGRSVHALVARPPPTAETVPAALRRHAIEVGDRARPRSRAAGAMGRGLRADAAEERAIDPRRAGPDATSSATSRRRGVDQANVVLSFALPMLLVVHGVSARSSRLPSI